MITVRARRIHGISEEGAIWYSRHYTQSTGLACRQIRVVNTESDYVNDKKYRDSTDNGRTWGPWYPAITSIPKMYGEDEMIFCGLDRKVWNPVHKHYFSAYTMRYFLEGHKKAYYELRTHGRNQVQDYPRIRIYHENEENSFVDETIRYESGADFNPENPRDPEFLYKNRAYVNPSIVMENGDIMFPLSIPVAVGCRLAGVDVEKVFPSFPTFLRCAIVARGRFDKVKERYDFTFSNPVILNDLRSSRGIDEPTIVTLKSGRVLMIMRGSNIQMPQWNTRIEKGTPAFKWYAWSDDGGQTFTEPEPWHFDDGEVIYSPASISELIRSQRNGKLYWIGNITTYATYGNYPRFPLQIVEIDEENGTAKKESLTVIDTRREGEPECVQLSNFRITEDRETGIIEVGLCKLGQLGQEKPHFGETWQYDIDLGE